MCKELLRVQRREQANFFFILGHPSPRPTWTTEHKAAFLLLFKKTKYDQMPVSLGEMAMPLQDLLRMGFASDLLAQGHDAKTLFLTAIEGKIDVTVLPATNRKTKP
jgi:hypothetical protein